MVYGCPVCFSEERKHITSTFRGADGERAFIRCSNCSLAYLYPPRSSLQEQAYYDADCQLQEVVKEEGLDFQNYIRNLQDDTKRRLAFCQKYVSLKDKILDVGCGYGYFVKVFRDHGYQASGIEPSVTRAEKGKEYFQIPIIPGYLEQGSRVVVPSSIDAITAFHVLEHVYSPDELLGAMYEKLKPGGRVIIEVPSGSDYMFFFRPYAAFVYQSAHYIYYTADHLQRVLERNRFRDIRITSIQRYSYLNALHWLYRKRAQIRKPVREAKGVGKIVDGVYKKTLSVLNRTDTLIAVAVK